MPRSFLYIFLIGLFFMNAQFAKGQVAGFKASDTSGCVPLIVHFTNTSTGATGYSWNLGNSTTASTTDASGSYTAAGTYTVTLTASNGVSTNTTTKIIRVYAAPTVNFSVSATGTCPDVPVTFNSTSVPNSWGTLTYNWNFGDGGTSALNAPVYAYPLPGFYNVSLFATNGPGCIGSLTKTAYITVYNHSVVGFTATPTNFCKTPKGVTFTNTTTGKAPLTYKWQFGDGGTSVTANPTYTYVTPGTFNVTLKATDGYGCVDSIVDYSLINAGSLAASFTASTTVCTGIPVNFNNTSTPHISSQWYFGDGGTSTDELPVYTYATSGSYTVKLVVFDGACYDSVSRSITIAPSPTGSISSTPLQPCQPPVSVTYTASVGTGTTVAWRFGDGTTGTGLTKVKNYTSAVIDFVEMTLTSSGGCKSVVTRIDTIFNMYLNPTATSTNGCAPLSTTFGIYPYSVVFNSFTSSFDFYSYPFKIVSYSWDFGDGTPLASGATPSHTYATPGTYTVKCNVVTANGCIGTGTVTISAGTKPVASFTSSPRRICSGRPINFVSTSTGAIDYYNWDYGDFNPDAGPTLAKPVHAYTAPGIYTTRLIVENMGCPSLPFYLTDTVDSPNAVIKRVYDCIPANSITFTNLSIGANTHLWQFGDATTSTINNPVHVYPALSTYTVTLTTHNVKSGCRDTTYLKLDLARPSMNMIATKTRICRDQIDTINAYVGGNGSPASKYKWYVNGILKDTAGDRFITRFPTTGLQTIRLIITNKYGCQDTLTSTNYILVAKPTVNFSISPPTGCAPLTVNFTDASTDVPGATMNSFLWTFGDGGTNTLGSPGASYTYTAAGTYTVKQIIKDDVGCADTLIHATKVIVDKPQASFNTLGPSACKGAPVNFTNTSKFATGYLWIFGDGATSTLTAPSHIYTAAGIYTLKLVAFEAHGCTDTMVKVNYLNVNPSPVASFYMDDSFAVCAPLNVKFTNTSSGATSYLWAFGDGSFSAVTSPSSPYIASGFYTVKLTAKNGFGCTDTGVGHVNIFGYKGAFTYTPLKGCSPQVVHFKAVLGTVANIIWDFSDGNVSPSSLLDTISHTYTSPGKYVPKLFLTDTSGCSTFSLGADTIKVDTIIAAFTAAPATPCQGSGSLYRDASVSLYSAPASWLWTFGSSGTSTASTVIYTFTASGTYPVTLVVTDSFGCSASATKNITVNGAPAIIGGGLSVCSGQTTLLSNATSGGTWTSGNSAVATIGSSSGVVTAVAAGTTTITYLISTGCIRTAVVTVNPVPGVIAGGTGICNGLTTTLSSTTTGGVWSSTNTGVATIGSSSGFVSSISFGTTTITYNIPTTGCYVTTTVTVSSSPVAISGPTTVCLGASALLSNAVTGGAWSSASTAVVSIGSGTGIASGLALGTSTITYSLGSGCTVNTTVTVIPVPAAITGATSVCSGLTFTLSNATIGGRWSSSNTTVATVGSGTGIVAGVAGGTDTIYYTLTTGCSALKSVTVHPVAPITGLINICAGNAATLSSAQPGGSWSSTSTSVAAIGSVSGIVIAKAVGTTTIRYLLPTGCAVTTTVTVIGKPSPITGPASVCVGNTALLSSATTGGTWTSDNTSMATIGSSSGLVNALTSGTVLISYSIGSGCSNIATVIINPISPVTGPTGVCIGQTITLRDTTLGGTWSSSNTAVATVGTGSGIAKGIAAGTAVINYVLASGCSASYTITVAPLPPAIAGRKDVCAGSSTTLTNPAPGGTWSASNTTIAGIGFASGIVSGITAGTTTISYSVAGCPITTMFTVNPLPAAITGNTVVCIGATATLSNGTTGGVWSSSNPAVATIGSSSGIASGIANGTATITYTLPTGCMATRVQSVNPLPAAITGATRVCEGLSTTLSNGTTGGTWSSSNTAVATIGISLGVVTGKAGGTVTITYTAPNACTADFTFTVDPSPAAISGISQVCVGSSITLSNTGGGTWGSSATAVATVGLTTGLVGGVMAGVDTITYTLPTGCITSTTITVHPLPLPITGTPVMCATLSTTLSDASVPGNWTSSNTAIAMADAALGIITGVTAGTATITYTLGTGCATTAGVTVYPFPKVITGPDHVCLYVPVTLTDTVAGGTWTSDNTAVATIGLSSGILTGITLGTATISYNIGSSCAVSVSVSVMPLPVVYTVTGGGNFCSGGTGKTIGLNGSENSTDYFLYLGGVMATGPLAGTSLPLDFGLQTVAGKYTVVATNTTTGCSNTMAGSGVITITPSVVPAIYTTTGKGDTVCSGVSTTFTSTIANGGTAPKYAWYINGMKVSTATFYTFVPADKDKVTCFITSNAACATPDTAYSRHTLTVSDPKLPSVSLSTLPGDTVCSGEKVTFSPVPVFGGIAPSYKWRVNGGMSGSGPTFTYVPVKGDIVSALMTSNFPCFVTKEVPSNSVALTVEDTEVPHITITASPAAQIQVGTTYTLTASATGVTAPTYQWIVNGLPVAGQTSNVFTNNTANIPMQDSVSCVVTGHGLCNITTHNWIYISSSYLGVMSAPAEAKLTIIPNPTKGEFIIMGTINTGNDKNVTLEITDLLGQVVYTGESAVQNGSVDKRIVLGNTLANGMYLLTVRSDSDNKVFHIVLER